MIVKSIASLHRVKAGEIKVQAVNEKVMGAEAEVKIKTRERNGELEEKMSETDGEEANAVVTKVGDVIETGKMGRDDGKNIRAGQ